MRVMGTHHTANRIATALRRLFGGDAGAGLILIAAASLAMIAVNSPLEPRYDAVFHGHLALTPVAELDSLHLWINDALMAVFFFVVGLEIKREVLDGELSDPARRRLPILAALAGMAAPAAVYLSSTKGIPAYNPGWAIPAATDIAFALGVIGLAGPRVPASLRLFLLTVAIVDDLGAVAIIALFYTVKLDPAWLGAALAVWLAMIVLNRLRIARGAPYAVLAVLLWYCVLHSGVHATIAGVLAALTIPLGLDRRGDSLLLRMEHALAPLSAYLIVPLFGFANAGVTLTGGSLLAPLPLAVGAGLFLGKQAGIFGTIWLAERIGLAPRPAGASWLQVWGVSLLCGIGFTMSLFIAALAFPAAPMLVDEAKIGILGGSLLSALLGFAVLRFAPRNDLGR